MLLWWHERGSGLPMSKQPYVPDELTGNLIGPIHIFTPLVHILSFEIEARIAIYALDYHWWVSYPLLANRGGGK